MSKPSVVVQATLAGIEQAGKGIPEELGAEALEFVLAYAKTHLYFSGGDVLLAWRLRVGSSSSDQDWRNRWGAIIVKAKTQGFIRKVGRVRPKSKQSHTLSLVLWQSMVYEGDDQPVSTAFNYINELRGKVHTREIDVHTALWRAYEYAKEEG